MSRVLGRLRGGAEATTGSGRDEWERTMLRLAYVSYFGCSKRDAEQVRRSVVAGLRRYEPRQELVWGPALNEPNPIVATDAMMFVVRDGPRYTVVIRGTNPTSLRSWLFQDFAFLQQRRWSEVSPETEAPPEAMVSDGAWRTMRLLRGLRPAPGIPGERQELARFLEGIEVPGRELELCFTGHSLGGLAAPTMALWARELLGPEPSIRVCAFAGPTAGNEDFVRYSNERLAGGAEACLCFGNELDFAASAWCAEALEETGTRYEAQLMELALVGLARLFAPELRRLGYTRLGLHRDVPSSFTLLPGGLQVIWQHIWPYASDLLGAREATRLVWDVARAMLGLRLRLALRAAIVVR